MSFQFVDFEVTPFVDSKFSEAVNLEQSEYYQRCILLNCSDNI